MTTHSRTLNDGKIRNPGPFLAKVVSHLDPSYMGNLQVQLLKISSSGNTYEAYGESLTVRYLSPFYGVTPISAALPNDNYQSTQQSYGWWAVPPDVGQKVLCFFVEGDKSRGYWMGCVQDEFMNFMVPGATPASAFNSTGDKVPVGEYNKKINRPAQTDATRYSKAVNTYALGTLIQQGLDLDEIRGLTSSSARREVPSMVFGVSTPGPIDKRGPRGQIGTSDIRALRHTSRLGGSSFVMDDGDPSLIRKTPAGGSNGGPSEYVNVEAGETGGDPSLPHNELIRLKTRTGHQILLHNTEDLIYIGNARGTTWIEMTSNGKIDIYAQDSISVHSNQDLNFTADRDINFTAGKNVNWVVGDEWKQDVGKSINVTSGDYISQNAAEAITNNAGSFINNYAADSITCTAQGKIAIQSAGNLNLGSTSQIGIEACGDLKLSTDGNFHNKALGNMNTQADLEINSLSGLATKITSGEVMGIKSTGANVLITGSSDIHLNGPTAPSATEAVLPPIADPTDPVPPLRAAQTARVPQHEPWPQHENTDPTLFTPDKTRAGSPQASVFPPEVYDTFNKNVGRTAAQRNTSRTVDPATQSNYDATQANRSVSSSNRQAYSGTPTEALTSAPGLIEGFTNAETVSYLNAIGQRESNLSYDAVNTLNFSGKYQFGKFALYGEGYLNTTTGTNTEVITNPANWTGKDGITDQQAWLEAPDVQESAMIGYTNKNLQYLKNNGGILDGDSKAQIMGMLAGAHLLGPTGMKNWRLGQGGADAYGTTGDEYYQIGSSVIGGSSNVV
jgi:uncharacterized protein (DUF2345 family)